jgi:DNA modification methylase
MDVLKGLKQLKSESIDCVMTSPPYWGLRDYGVKGQIGLEPHPQEFINKMVEIFEEVKRVLKKTGSVYLNLGDTYFGATRMDRTTENASIGAKRIDFKFDKDGSNWLQPKQLMLMPSRVAIALQENGWILRNDIIWNKPNPMPSSVKDRLNTTYEHVFHFVKSRKYYYDLHAIREKNKCIDKSLKGKNPGDFWSIVTQPFKEAHFAVFPEALCLKPLKASVPKWICKKCEKPRTRLIETNNPSKEFLEWDEYRKSGAKGSITSRQSVKSLHRNKGGVYYSGKTIGFTECECGKKFGYKAGTVLDPFMGAGTVLKVAQDLRINAIGIELKPEYCEIEKKRLKTGQTFLNGDINKVELI